MSGGRACWAERKWKRSSSPTSPSHPLFLRLNNVIHSSLLAFLPLFIVTHIQHPVGRASVLEEQSQRGLQVPLRPAEEWETVHKTKKIKFGLDV